MTSPAGRSGFTLIECIMATIIILLGFLAVASVFPASYRGATQDLNHTTAVRLAQNVLEGIRIHAYGTPLPPTLLNTAANAFTLPGAVENNTATSAIFTSAVSFENGSAIGAPIPGNTNDTSDVATVTITWKEGTGPGSTGTQKVFVLQGGISREP